MKVNRNNYEVWLLDYSDGKLNAAQTADLMAFLEENPDMKEEFDAFDAITLEPEYIRFKQKAQLKKLPVIPAGEVDENNYEHFFIAWHENDLTPSQKDDVLAFLEQNPQLEPEFRLHGKLQITANEEIVFPEKEQLRKGRKIAAYWWPVAAAALFLLLFAMYGLLKKETVPQVHNYGLIGKMEPVSIVLPSAVLTGVRVNSFPIPLTENKVIETREITVKQDVLNSLPDRSVEIALAMPSISFKTQPISMENSTMPARLNYETKKPKQKNLLARIFKNLAGKLSGKQAKNNKQGTHKKEPAMLRVLDRSILVFNTVTGSKTELEKTYDQEGNLTQYRVEGESLLWSKNVNLN
ncbi:MAG TPA: hypothetical protein ENH02_06790, partial [Bacteroidetes bacterium]|nr:hypothetical protein [Bacteroidota bacterium]